MCIYGVRVCECIGVFIKYDNFISIFSSIKSCELFGIKAEGRISKRVLQENKACQIFRKINTSYPQIHTRTCTYQRVRNVRFSEYLACFVLL